MAQQRIKFVLAKPNQAYTTTVEPDVNTLTAQPVALDTDEHFRLIVHDTSIDPKWLADQVQQFVRTIADGRRILDASVL